MQALLAAVSKQRPVAAEAQRSGDFAAVLADAAELSRRCAEGPGEAIAALKDALAATDPAHLAAQTGPDTPLLLNLLLAAAQGIPVAEVRCHSRQRAVDAFTGACMRSIAADVQ